MLILSAGSSVSTRDMTAEVIASLGTPGVLVHGVSLKPGKPTILAMAGGKPVFGLPGNPVSCMVTFDLFVAPTLALLSGCRERPAPRVAARLTQQHRLGARPRGLRPGAARAARRRAWAEPVFGKSNLIYTLVRSDGMVRIELEPGRPGGGRSGSRSSCSRSDDATVTDTTDGRAIRLQRSLPHGSQRGRCGQRPRQTRMPR